MLEAIVGSCGVDAIIGRPWGPLTLGLNARSRDPFACLGNFILALHEARFLGSQELFQAPTCPLRPQYTSRLLFLEISAFEALLNAAEARLLAVTS